MEARFIRLQCCCEKKLTFPFRVRDEHADPESKRVTATVGCPFCDKACRVELRENQLPSATVYRGHTEPGPRFLQAKRTRPEDVIFPTQPVSEEDAP